MFFFFFLFFLKLKIYTLFSNMPVLESNQNLSVIWKLSLSLRLSNHETRKFHELCGVVKDVPELGDIVVADKVLYMPRYSKKHLCQILFAMNVCLFPIYKDRELSYFTAHCYYLSVQSPSLIYWLIHRYFHSSLPFSSPYSLWL